MSALYPGYTHVQSLSTNHEDEEWEEIEEEYITIDLGSLAEPGLLFAEASSSGFRIVGLDTPTPFIQLAGTVFKGRVDALLGSEMLFEDGKYAGMASKRISCKEVRLNSKNIDPVFTKEKESEKQKGKQKAVGSQ